MKRRLFSQVLAIVALTPCLVASANTAPSEVGATVNPVAISVRIANTYIANVSVKLHTTSHSGYINVFMRTSQSLHSIPKGDDIQLCSISVTSATTYACVANLSLTGDSGSIVAAYGNNYATGPHYDSRSTDAIMMSCPSAGDCSEVGSNSQEFVASEVNGEWGTIEKLASIPEVGVDAHISSISCYGPQNCTITGDTSSSIPYESTESAGIWSTALRTPAIDQLSCTSAGNCTGQSVSFTSSLDPGFVTYSEVAGVWGPEQDIPLTVEAAQAMESFDCTNVGDCSDFLALSGSPSHTSYVMNEVNGVWGPEHELTGGVPGVKQSAGVFALTACSSAGNCAAVGATATEGFAISETNEVWSPAVGVTATRNLNQGYAGAPIANSGVVNCTSTVCTATFQYSLSYRDVSKDSLVTVSYVESNGTWKLSSTRKDTGGWNA